MGIYGEAAINVVQNYNADKAKENKYYLYDEWDSQISKLRKPQSKRAKGCPKSAFLGLCEEGVVKGIPKGSYFKKKHMTIKNMRWLFMKS